VKERVRQFGATVGAEVATWQSRTDDGDSARLSHGECRTLEGPADEHLAALRE
jgi:hypothetical protein